jgi:hypothetical protein
MKMNFQGGASVPTSFGSEGTTEISQLRSGWIPAQNISQVPPGRRTFSIVPSGRGFLRTVFQPLRSWLLSGCRFATPLAMAALILFFAVGATAQTNALSDAEIQGRQLTQQLLEQRPATNFILTGSLSIRDEKGSHLDIPIKFKAIVTPTNWYSVYQAFPTNGLNEELSITHNGNSPNKYFHHAGSGIGREPEIEDQSVIFPGKTDELFSYSDFSIGDLGLEFFHWPEQKVLPKTANLKRGREYTLLESTNPNPSTNGYSRVLTWIDKESGGILEAEAYDFNGKLLKDFAPKSFKKVNGQWQLQEMEIRNVQTGSRTRLEFDLEK